MFLKNLIDSIINILIFFFLIFLKIIKKFIFVRISNVSLERIGGIYSLDWELSKKKLNKIQTVDIYIYSDKYDNVNKFWKKLWSNEVYLIKVPNRFIKQFNFFKQFNIFKDIIINNVPVNINGEKLHLFQKNKSNEIIEENNLLLKCILKNKQSNIKINDSDLLQGKNFLKKIDAHEKEIICIHNRDNSFLNKTYTNKDWSYHDYRDFNPNDFKDTIIEMINRGYFVIRVGSITKDNIDFKDKNFFDYSKSEFRSDFLDIYLLSVCKFFISSDSGISAISEIFRKPIVYVNKSLHWENHRWTFEAIIIYKKFFSKLKNKFLSFEESYNLRIGDIDTKYYLDNNQIKIIDNSKKEILEAAIEMDDYLKKKIKYSENDEILQNKYWNLFKPNDLRSSNLRISKYFLEKNKFLL